LHFSHKSVDDILIKVRYEIAKFTLYMHIPTLGIAGTNGKWQGIEDNLWNAGTHLSKLTEQ
jgi:hypothetical protein